MLDFYDVCHNLHMDVLRAVALGLEMDEKFFDPLADEAWHTLRLLNYPPVAKKLLQAEGQARAGAHSGIYAHPYRVLPSFSLFCSRLWLLDICLPGRCELSTYPHLYLLMELLSSPGRWSTSPESSYSELHPCNPNCLSLLCKASCFDSSDIIAF